MYNKRLRVDNCNFKKMEKFITKCYNMNNVRMTIDQKFNFQ